MGLQHTLNALADPIRRDILNLLKNGKMSAGYISNHFPVTAASISRHLSVLKEADLIRDNREGKFIFYELYSRAEISDPCECAGCVPQSGYLPCTQPCA